MRSYREINYALRPAKAVERKMLCDVFRRLHPFRKLETYRYIGFGSIYFSDYHLFHRALGIVDMLSIEKDAYAKECFEFNRPYGCVRIDFRHSNNVLPELQWQTPTIVWLDYDGMLDSSVLSDVVTIANRASSGTFLVITVNANPLAEPNEDERRQYEAETGHAFDLDAFRLNEFAKAVGDNAPAEITGRDLRGEGLARISRRMIVAKIEEILAARNGLLASEERLRFQQIVHFSYRDAARMLTVGGILFTERDRHVFQKCAFADLPYARFDQEPYAIQVPCLTPKEIRYLNASLPCTNLAQLTLPGVPSAEIAKYAAIYRCFPTFAEAVFA